MKHPRAGVLAASCAGLAVSAAVLVPGVVAPASALASASRAQQVYDGMSDAQRVGQLLMIGCPSTTVGTTCPAMIRRYSVGSVILVGNSTLSIAAQRTVATGLQRSAPAHDRLFVATDQEGGLVRRMRGPGFSTVPSALTQGTWDTADLKRRASTWGGQLKAAGINLNLWVGICMLVVAALFLLWAFTRPLSRELGEDDDGAAGRDAHEGRRDGDRSVRGAAAPVGADAAAFAGSEATSRRAGRDGSRAAGRSGTRRK
jgi:hypothetical protein